MHRIKIVAVLILFMGIITETHAQINALEHTLQKREALQRFDSARFVDHTFLSFAIGPEMLCLDRSISNHKNLGMRATLYWGKWFSPVSGMRFGLNGGFLPTDVSANGVKRVGLIGISADYMMNLSALGSYYNPNRVFEIVGIAGIGYDFSIKKKNYSQAADVHAGLQAKFNVSPLLDLFIEPKVSVYSDGVDQVSSWRNYDITASLLLGATYKMVPVNLRRVSDPFRSKSIFDNLFISMGVGGQSILQNPLKESIRQISPIAALSVGKWFSPYSAVRLSLTGGYNDIPVSGEDQNLRHIGLQADYMLNLNSVFQGYDRDRLFNLIAIAGVNYTLLHKEEQYKHTPGIGVGLQADFRISDNVNLFLEPRVNLYTNRFAGGLYVADMDIQNYVLAGLTYKLVSREYRRSNRQPLEKSGYFAGNMFFNLYGGVQGMVVSDHYGMPLSKYINPKIGISIGKQFTALSAVRVSAEAGLLGVSDDDSQAHRFKMISGSVDYMLNLSSLLVGYNPGRKTELSAIAGFNMTAHTTSTGLNIDPGIQIGLQGMWNVTPTWGVYLEPMLRFYPDRFAPSNIRLAKFDALGSLQVGVNYRLSPQQASSDWNIFKSDRSGKPVSKDLPDDLFISMGVGGQSILRSPLKESIRQLSPIAALSVGKWFSPYSAVRLSLTGGYNDVSASGNSFNLKHIGLQADYMLNLVNVFGGYDRDRLFNLMAVAGVNYTVLHRGDKYNHTPGVGGGLQADFRISDNVNLFLEPRINLFTNRFAGGLYMSDLDVQGYALAGLTYKLVSREYRRNNRQPFEKSGYFAGNMFFSLFGGIQGMFVPNHYGMPLSQYANPKVGASMGKQFTSLSAVRLTAEAGLLGIPDDKSQPHRFKMISGSVDYMLNLSSLLVGYNPERKTELSAIAGFNMTAHTTSTGLRVDPGVQIGLQGMWNVTPTWGVYLEPMLRIYPDGFAPSNIRLAKLDALGSLQVGVNYRLNSQRAVADWDIFKQNKKPKTYISVALGATELFTGRVRSLPSSQQIGLIAGLSVGRDFSPLSSWRVNAVVQRTTKGKIKNEFRKTQYAGISADYMINLTTLFCGYRSDRVFDLLALGGIDAGMSYTDEKLHLVPGVHGGGQARFAINPNVSLYAEPKLTLYRDNFDGMASGYRFDPVLSLSFGVNYYINKRTLPRHSENFNKGSFLKNTFIAADLGSGFFGNTIFGPMPLRQKLTLNGGIAVGKKFNPVSALRVGMSVHKVTSNSKTTLGLRVMELNADYMLNLTNCLFGYKSDRLFNLSGIAGALLKWDNDDRVSDPVLGIRLGAQGAFRINDDWQIYIEPRAGIYPRKVKNQNTKIDGTADMVFGVTYNF